MAGKKQDRERVLNAREFSKRKLPIFSYEESFNFQNLDIIETFSCLDRL